MIRIDFHTHTHHSYDCRMDPVKVLKLARERGLGAIVINDHDTIKGGLETKARNPYNDLEVIVGAEIKTDVGDITGIFLKEEIQARRHPEVIAEIKRQGGIVILNHPYIQHKLSEIDYSGIDFIEGYNGRTDAARNQKAMELAAKENKPVLSGSDAHTYTEIARCYTTFENYMPGTLGIPVSQHYRRSGFFSIERSKLIKAVKRSDAKLFMKVLAVMPVSFLKYHKR